MTAREVFRGRRDRDTETEAGGRPATCRAPKDSLQFGRAATQPPSQRVGRPRNRERERPPPLRGERWSVRSGRSTEAWLPIVLGAVASAAGCARGGDEVHAAGDAE